MILDCCRGDADREKRKRRTQTLVDLIVEPMSFDRIGTLGNSSTMKARLREEVRLVELAQSTRVRYTF